MRKLLHNRWHILQAAFVAIVATGFIASGSLLIWASTLTIPSLESFDNRQVAQSTKIYDKTEETLLYDLHGDVNRTVVPFDQMSRHIKNATVALEDDDFYEHHGIKFDAIVRATLVNLLSLEFEQGGSTITQQVVKNSLLTNEKTIARKLKEWVLAVKLEQRYSKERILEMYLNEVPYGGNVYGVEEAAQRFFDTSAEELTLAQSAYLAALPKAPTYYSPYGNNRDALEARKNYALERMYENDFISERTYEEATAKDVAFQPREEAGIRAPHFVIWIREQLVDRYGEEAVKQRGFEVTTTLDYDMQQDAQRIVEENARRNAEQFNAENAGLVAIDPKTGGIRAMVGSRDYFDDEIDGNVNVALAQRQPGSAFKPFIYAAAFNRGFTPATTVFDVHTQFSTACEPSTMNSQGDCYAPVNYDGTFRGPVTFREALAQSINVPSVKAFYLAGLDRARELAINMGVTGLKDTAQYGLTLVLGGGEVRLLDMTSAYGVFANDGVRVPYAGIQKIESADGTVLFERSPSENRVLPQQTARQISDVLSDNQARTPAFGSNSPLHFPNFDVAAKTGTTNDYRDAWIIGYTPNLAVGTWAGNNDSSSMNKKVAGYIVAPMWNEFMDSVLPDLPNASFQEPEPLDAQSLNPRLRGFWRGGQSYTVDTASGKRATEYTPDEFREERVVTDIHSILHFVDKNDPSGPIPNNPADDPQYRYWEHAVERWADQQDIEEEDPEDVIPDEEDDVHTPENAPAISVLTPDEDETFRADERIRVSIETDSEYEPEEASYYFNGTYVGSAESQPFRITFTPTNYSVHGGTNDLRIVVRDAVGNTGEHVHDITIGSTTSAR
jgi:1A family penicillin-binding protein